MSKKKAQTTQSLEDTHLLMKSMGLDVKRSHLERLEKNTKQDHFSQIQKHTADYMLRLSGSTPARNIFLSRKEENTQIFSSFLFRPENQLFIPAQIDDLSKESLLGQCTEVEKNFAIEVLRFNAITEGKIPSMKDISTAPLKDVFFCDKTQGKCHPIKSDEGMKFLGTYLIIKSASIAKRDTPDMLCQRLSSSREAISLILETTTSSAEESSDERKKKNKKKKEKKDKKRKEKKKNKKESLLIENKKEKRNEKKRNREEEKDEDEISLKKLKISSSTSTTTTTTTHTPHHPTPTHHHKQKKKM
jgi:hypothetical protein